MGFRWKMGLGLAPLLGLACGGGSGEPVASGDPANPGSGGTVRVFENFDQATLPTVLGVGSQGGGTVTLESDPSQTYGGSGRSLMGHYPQGSGGVYVWGGYGLSSLNTRNLYVRFRARMSAPPFGLKFLKVFGQHGTNDGYANTTFGMDYTGADPGGMVYVAFGDGSFLQNDTTTGVWLDGSNSSYIGRAQGLPGVQIQTPQGRIWSSTDWGTAWHLFEFHVKFNSGTSAQDETNDGELFVRIDGKVYVDAKGLFNRHSSNPPIESVQIFGWTQPESGTSQTPAFDIWYDNLEISTDGWGDSPV